jgi:hypothetical protein
MNNFTATIAMKASSQKSDGTSPVVTLKAIFEQLAEKHALPKKQVGEMMADLVTAVTAWSPRGAHLMLKVRCAAMNGALEYDHAVAQACRPYRRAA